MKPMTADQLTLAGLINELSQVPLDAPIRLAGFGSAAMPGELFRHRPYVDGLAIRPTMVRSNTDASADEYIGELRRHGLGKTWWETIWEGPQRVQFVDRHPATFETPMWVSVPGEISFNAITGVEMVKGFAVIRSVNLAPMQGPTIQRIPDEEVERRMQKVDEQLRGEATTHSPKVVKWLINMASRERTTVRLDLGEARSDLVNFEASLQAKRDRVAKLEADAARNDYLLGITDDLPAILKAKDS
jgi:hypothetical protein